MTNITCPADMLFNSCGSVCNSTCETFYPLCEAVCVPRCECASHTPVWFPASSTCGTQASCFHFDPVLPLEAASETWAPWPPLSPWSPPPPPPAPRLLSTSPKPLRTPLAHAPGLPYRVATGAAFGVFVIAAVLVYLLGCRADATGGTRGSYRPLLASAVINIAQLKTEVTTEPKTLTFTSLAVSK